MAKIPALARNIDLHFQQRQRSRHIGQASRFVQLPLADVRVQIQGEGPVLVTCPDAPNCIEQNAELNALLAASSKVVCFEQPGFGFSRASRVFDFSLEHYAAVLIGLLEALELRDVVLALPCISGYVAIQVAQQRPDLVSKVILIQTPSLPEQHRWLRRVSGFGLLTTPLVGQGLVRMMPGLINRLWYTMATSDHRRLGLLTNTMDAMRRGADNCMASAFQAVLRQPDPKWSPLAQPGLIVWGSQDRTHRGTDRHSTHLFLPNARMHEFPTGHFPELESPTAFAHVVRGFMQQSEMYRASNQQTSA